MSATEKNDILEVSTVDGEIVMAAGVVMVIMAPEEAENLALALFRHSRMAQGDRVEVEEGHTSGVIHIDEQTLAPVTKKE